MVCTSSFLSASELEAGMVVPELGEEAEEEEVEVTTEEVAKEETEGTGGEQGVELGGVVLG